mmetsp:Transcript_29497/g.43733  ORF Transcript_29497/g.43733 Transcript_29497/m.43733 type:complete len:88 (+) Transcript_29497:659-922(+)
MPSNAKKNIVDRTSAHRTVVESNEIKIVPENRNGEVRTVRQHPQKLRQRMTRLMTAGLHGYSASGCAATKQMRTLRGNDERRGVGST